MIKDFVKIIIDFIAFNHAQSFVIFFEINKRLCDILGVATGAGVVHSLMIQVQRNECEIFWENVPILNHFASRDL